MNRDLAVTHEESSWAVEPFREQASPESDAPILDLPMILRIVSEWRWLIMAAVGGGAALGILYSLVVTPMYRSSVLLQVNPPTVQILDEKSDAPVTGTAADFVATQVGLLQSSALARDVAESLKLADNPQFADPSLPPAKRLQAAAHEIGEGIEVTPPAEGELIRFSFASSSPQIAANVANGVADEFISSSLRRKYESSSYARTFLQKQIGKTRGELERSERGLVQYAQAEGIVSTGDQSGSPVEGGATSPQAESLSALNQALADVTAKRVTAQAAYEAGLTSGVTSTENDATQALRQSRAALVAQYQQKRTLMKPDHPEMISLKSQIAELERQIAQENGKIESGRIGSLRADYQAAAAAEAALRRRVADAKSQVLDLRGRSVRYAILQRDVDTNRALYNALLQRYKEIGVDGGIGTTAVSIVDRADVPSAPYKPNFLLDVAVGLGLGFLLGVAAAVALEYLNDTIRTPEDVRKKLRLACLGAIPNAKGKFLDNLQDPTSPITEAYSTLAAALHFSTESGDPKCLLLTSTKQAEGKSSTAVAIAQNYARRGKSVLLVDGDLRKPVFTANSKKIGLTKLLTGPDPLFDHIVATAFENLYLLPAGPTPPNPADLLSTPRFRDVVEEAKRHFDLVVIDAPPVLGLADSTLMASVCNQLLFVIECGKTRTKAADEALRKLQAAGGHVLGATLTRATGVARGYGYGYGYGYGRTTVDKTKTEIALLDAHPNG